MSRQNNRVAEQSSGQLPNPQVKKLIVAVHGIGDHFNFETIQTVAYRFCRFLGLSNTHPLGSFHATQVGQTGAFALKPGDEYESVWPVVIALAGFLYLWWLAAMLLDLVMVWHSYIQNSLVMDGLRNMTGWTERNKPRRRMRRKGAVITVPEGPVPLA